MIGQWNHTRNILCQSLLTALFLFFAVPAALADCTVPDAIAGTVIYNGTQKTIQYCDGTNWIAMHSPGSGSGGCTGPAAPDGAIIYSEDDNLMQACVGNVWQAMGLAGSGGGGGLSFDNSPGQWKQVSAGGLHTCAIDKNDELWCWGRNNNGQLGDGSFTNSSVPVRVGTDTWKAVSAGNTHACGIKTDDSLWCWGDDTYGKLGNGAGITADQENPSAANDGGASWKAVSAGTNGTCGIKTDDSLWCWGRDNQEQLGDGAGATNQDSPVSVNDGGASWKAVSAGNTHACGIKTDDSAWCWGNGAAGRVGSGGTADEDSPATLNDGGASWKVVDVGKNYACGIKTNDSAWCWGDNTYGGQLGNGTTTGFEESPVALDDGGATWQTVDGGGAAEYHTCGIKTDGSLWCWGSNMYGALGAPAVETGIINDLFVLAVTGGASWKAISAGNVHTCGIQSDDSLWCWGSDYYEQLGDGAGATNQFSPVSVNDGGASWKAVSAGNTHACGIKTDDSLWCWGNDFSDQLGNGAPTGTQDSPVSVDDGGASWKAISAGNYHTCGIKTDDSAWCWGKDDHDQLGDGPGATNQASPVSVDDGGASWKAISAGEDHTCGIKTDDSLWCWGWGNSGRLGTGNTSTQKSPAAIDDGGATWKDIDAGYHTCGLKSDDTIWCWGDLWGGPYLSPVVISDGVASWEFLSYDGGNNYHGCGIKSDGSAWCWGYTNLGQLGGGYEGKYQGSPVVKGAGLASIQCTSPSADPGALLYNSSDNVLQYCGGASWVGIGKAAP